MQGDVVYNFLRTLPLQADTKPLNTYILKPCREKVNKFDIVTDFPCLFGLSEYDFSSKTLEFND